MSTIRGVKDRRFKFVQLLNTMFEDKDLSLKAKGFIGYCLTKPPQWRFHIGHLCTVLKEGEKAIYAIITECVVKGYACRYQPRSESGEFKPWQTIISDSKEEIEEIKKELLAADKLNKCLPDSCFGDADLGDADFGPPSNTELSNTEEKQQPAAAVSFPKKTKSDFLDEPYECLKDLEVSSYDKHFVSSVYDEAVVKKAVEWIKHPKTKITTTTAQALKWACKFPPEIPIDPKIELLRTVSQNKEYVKPHDEEKGKFGTINVLSKIVEFTPNGGQGGVICIEYGEKDFVERFNEARRKFGFPPIDRV